MHTSPDATSQSDLDGSIPLGFGGVKAAVGDHIAHFFRGGAQRFSVLGPYIKTGLQEGDRCVFISQPKVGAALCEWLSERGVDAADAREADRLILDPGRDTAEDMRRLADRIDASVQETGDAFVRWSGDGGWCLDCNITVDEMLRWEALYDEHSSGWRLLALCQFDLTVFESDVIMDALRTHPYCVMGDVVVPNPFHESPDAVRNELTSEM